MELRVKRITGILFSLAILAGLMLTALAQPAYAEPGNNQQYVERGWNGSKVVESTKTAIDVAWMTDGHTQMHNGWWYTRDVNVTINYRVSVDAGATANIILMDGVTMTFADGINVPESSTLNIYCQQGGSGELHCIADTNDNAAIGADNEAGACGTINIYGGKITADASQYGTEAAGIGGGDGGSGGTVNVYGGEVNAIGSECGAGIGGGDDDGWNTRAGKVRIYGGTVNATGGYYGAGIGGGEGAGGAVDVKIYGGTVKATGGAGGAGIGGGINGANGDANVEIFDGNVTAQGGSNATGIGGGENGGSVNLTMKWGNIVARGSGSAPAIGANNGYEGGTVTFDGALVQMYPGSGARAVYAENINLNKGYQSVAYRHSENEAMTYARVNGKQHADNRIYPLSEDNMQLVEVKNCHHESFTCYPVIWFGPERHDVYCNSCDYTYREYCVFNGRPRKWNWSGDYSRATAEVPCSKCWTSVYKTIGATVTKEEKDGKIIYTATIQAEGRTYTDVKEVVIEHGDTDEMDNLSSVLYNGLDNAEKAAAAAEKKTTSIRSAKALKGRKAALKWKKVSSADGYQIEYSAKGEKTKKISVSGAGKLTKTVKKLKAGKTYSFRVRPYTRVAGMSKLIYGKWSKAKKCRSKK